MMFIRLPYKIPILVQAQIGDYFKSFVGLGLRMEDGFSMNSKYEGKISVARVYGNWGQNEQLEIIHNISYYNKPPSMTYWVYLDEYNLMLDDFGKQDNFESRKKIDDLNKLLITIGII